MHFERARTREKLGGLAVMLLHSLVWRTQIRTPCKRAKRARSLLRDGAGFVEDLFALPPNRDVCTVGYKDGECRTFLGTFSNLTVVPVKTTKL